MDCSGIGAWLAATAAPSVLGRAYAATIALRGTKPRERAETFGHCRASFGVHDPSPGSDGRRIEFANHASRARLWHNLIIGISRKEHRRLRRRWLTASLSAAGAVALATWLAGSAKDLPQLARYSHFLSVAGALLAGAGVFIPLWASPPWGAEPGKSDWSEVLGVPRILAPAALFFAEHFARDRS